MQEYYCSETSTSQRTQGSHSQILMKGGWGRSDRGSYFIPKKITTSEFVYPKKSLLFLVYPKKSLGPFFTTQKNPSVFFFFPNQKNPGVFHRPKRITWQNLRPKKITWTPPSLKYVSGAPGPKKQAQEKKLGTNFPLKNLMARKEVKLNSNRFQIRSLPTYTQCDLY